MLRLHEESVGRAGLVDVGDSYGGLALRRTVRVVAWMGRQDALDRSSQGHGRLA
jgi:hypothetical protein